MIEIGREFSRKFGSPFLKIGKTLLIFRESENIPDLEQLLYRTNIG